MSETYCGKICEECTHKERIGCLGCKPGQGTAATGECDLAKCCKGKGHSTCDTCSFHTTCGTLRGRGNEPEYRLRKMAIEAEIKAEREAELARRAPFLGKWLWLLFLLVIPGVLAGIMTDDNVVQWIPALYIPGLILDVCSTVAYGLILLKVSKEEAHYRTAGICSLVAGGISALVAVISVSSVVTWTLILTLSAALVGMFGEYHEYMGHAAVLHNLDDELSEKWCKLWKWFIGTFAAMFGSVIVTAIIPVLGLLALLAASIGVIVMSVWKLVYLYQTAQVFREYDI